MTDRNDPRDYDVREPAFKIVEPDAPVLLPCGCPEQIVHDEGHQTGCTEQEAAA